jgi:hypothetical protein
VDSPPTGLAVNSPPTGLAHWTRCGLASDPTRSLDSLWTRLRLDVLSGLDLDSPPTRLDLWTRCGLVSDWTCFLDSLWTRCPRLDFRSGLAVVSRRLDLSLTGLVVDSTLDLL